MKFTKPTPFLHGAILALILLGNASLSSCFAPSVVSNRNGAANNALLTDVDSLRMTKRLETEVDSLAERKNKAIDFVAEVYVRRSITSIVAICVLTLGISAPAFADEYGRETEARFLGTGEGTMICTKRGPLGACRKTVTRTEQNENDKSEKYFQQPTELVVRSRTAESSEGNLLIERLKQQSEENSEKNQLLVSQRTMLNDSSASFGPFDSQVLILNTDGKGFSLLANPQAMRLKKAGFIENKKFIRQPTQEELDAALEPTGPNLLDRIFGSN